MQTTITSEVSPKKGVTALLLCLFLGGFGFHRFYVGKIGTGILMLITLGGFGIWTIIDIIKIACCDFRDKQDRILMFVPQPSKKIIWIVLSIFLAAFITAIVFGVTTAYIVTKAPTEVAKSELAAVRAGDFDKAYTLTSSDFKASVPLETFKKFVASHPELSNYESASFPSREVKDDKALIESTLTAKDGSETRVQVYLVKENDLWKVLSIEFKAKE